MHKDKVGNLFFTEDEILEEIYKNPDITITNFNMDGNVDLYNNATTKHFITGQLHKVGPIDDDDLSYIYHGIAKNHWFMPQEYEELDIAKWVLDRCKTEAELQRVGEELIMFQERNMFKLLQYLKYFVDTMRENNQVIGVGRGSSVASYVLYLIGIHRIDSIYYDLPIEEFLRS